MSENISVGILKEDMKRIRMVLFNSPGKLKSSLPELQRIADGLGKHFPAPEASFLASFFRERSQKERGVELVRLVGSIAEKNPDLQRWMTFITFFDHVAGRKKNIAPDAYEYEDKGQGIGEDRAAQLIAQEFLQKFGATAVEARAKLERLTAPAPVIRRPAANRGPRLQHG